MEETALIHLDPVTGRPVAEVADAEGELQGYAVQRPPQAEAGVVFGRDFRKLTGKRAGAVYECRLWRNGEWGCTCEDFQHRFRRCRSRPRGSRCKHIAAAEAVWRLSESL